MPCRLWILKLFCVLAIVLLIVGGKEKHYWPVNGWAMYAVKSEPFIAKEKKMQELDRAPFGILGLETALGLVVTKLIEPGHLDWSQALEKLTM